MINVICTLQRCRLHNVYQIGTLVNALLYILCQLPSIPTSSIPSNQHYGRRRRYAASRVISRDVQETASRPDIRGLPRRAGRRCKYLPRPGNMR